MHPSKRREGRRIRKNRRRWEEVARAFRALNDPKIWGATRKALEDFAEVADTLRIKTENR